MFRDFGDASATTDNSWARRGGIWAEVLQAFSEVAKGGGASTLRKSEWHVATNSPASRRFALVVVRARQVERIAQVQSTWSEIAKHLNADLESQLKAANIAVTARFNTTLEDFVAPYARKSGSRVALLLGERWVERQPD